MSGNSGKWTPIREEKGTGDESALNRPAALDYLRHTRQTPKRKEEGRARRGTFNLSRGGEGRGQLWVGKMKPGVSI